MDPTSDKDLKNLKKRLEKDFDRTTRKSKGEIVGFFSGWQVIILIFLVAILLIMVFLRGEKNAPAEGWVSLKNRITKLEREMKSLNGTVRLLQRSVSDLEKMKTSLSEGSKRVEKDRSLSVKESLPDEAKIRKLTQDPTAAGSKPETQTVAENRIYKVQRGDTIYWIAKKHQLSVEELLRLNGMEKKQSIFPGQKLIIESSQ